MSTEEEGDIPSTAGGIDDTAAQLVRTAWTFDKLAAHFTNFFETFRGYMEKRSASMHRVAIRERRRGATE